MTVDQSLGKAFSKSCRAIAIQPWIKTWNYFSSKRIRCSQTTAIINGSISDSISQSHSTLLYCYIAHKSHVMDIPGYMTSSFTLHCKMSHGGSWTICTSAHFYFELLYKK